MMELTKEGESFFANSSKANKATFAFFKEVVSKKAEIDWNEYLEEKKELEALKGLAVTGTFNSTYSDKPYKSS